MDQPIVHARVAARESLAAVPTIEEFELELGS
jgi:hypothetical protein